MPHFRYEKTNAPGGNRCTRTFTLSSSKICCGVSIQHESWVTDRQTDRQTQTHTHSRERHNTHTHTPMTWCLRSLSPVLHVTGLVCSVITAGSTQSSLVRDKHAAGAPLVSHVVCFCPLIVSHHSSCSSAFPFSSQVFPHGLFFV